MNPFLSEGLKIGHVLTIPVRGEESAASEVSTVGTELPAPTKLATTPEETQETEEDNLYQSDNEQIYTVEKRREKLIEIAHRFNIDIDTIRQLNPNIPNNLRKGSIIITARPFLWA